MFDKWKAKNALCKAYKLYSKKKILYLKADTIDIYQQLEDIQYVIVYVLCEYFDFDYNFYYDFPFSYKWFIAYDYIIYHDDCRRAYTKLMKQHYMEKNSIWNKL